MNGTVGKEPEYQALGYDLKGRAQRVREGLSLALRAHHHILCGVDRRGTYMGADESVYHGMETHRDSQAERRAASR